MSIFPSISANSPMIIEPINERFDFLKSDIKGAVIEHLGYGVRSGLTTVAQETPNMTVTISGGICYLPDGTRVQVSQINKTISNPTIVQHTAEIHTTTASGTFYTDLGPIVDGNGNYAGTGNVTVRKTSDNSLVTVTAIDAVNKLVTTNLASATEVKIDYNHGQKRIDSVTIDSNGNVAVIQGTPADNSPNSPAIPSTSLELSRILVQPKQTIKIETADITNLNSKYGIWLDANNNLVVGGSLAILGSGTIMGSGNYTFLNIQGGIYNDQVGQPLSVLDNLFVSGSITLVSGGTVDGRDVGADGATLDAHIIKQVDTESADTTKDKHLSNALAKGWQDHILGTGNIHSTYHNQLLGIASANVGSTDTTFDKHISNALAKGWEDHKNSAHLTLGTTSTTAFRGDYGQTAYNHATTIGNAHNMDHAHLNAVYGANTSSTDTVKNKHVSDNMTKLWEDHRLAAVGHSDHVKGNMRISQGTVAPSSPSAGDLWIDTN